MRGITIPPPPLCYAPFWVCGEEDYNTLYRILYTVFDHGVFAFGEALRNIMRLFY